MRSWEELWQSSSAEGWVLIKACGIPGLESLSPLGKNLCRSDSQTFLLPVGFGSYFSFLIMRSHKTFFFLFKAFKKKRGEQHNLSHKSWIMSADLD